MKLKIEGQTIAVTRRDTYTALADAGATMPETQNSDNLAATVRSIPVGGAPVKSGMLRLTVGATSITIPDVGTEYNKIILVPWSLATAFNCDDLYNGCNACLNATNALATNEGVVSACASVLEPTQTSGVFRVISNSASPKDIFTFNGDGSVKVDLTVISWTVFRAGVYLWVAWAE